MSSTSMDDARELAMTSHVVGIGRGPDPGRVGDRREFGRALTELRERAGFTVRDIAAAVRIPPATAGDYFAGRSLPPVRMAWVLDAILRKCDVTDPAGIENWRRALLRLRRGSDEPPYLGAAPYETRHARWFHGRGPLVRALVDRLDTVRGGPLVVTGASGAGKSSVLRAGLLGTVDASSWQPVLLTPGRNPCRALADQLCATLGLPVDIVDHAVHARPHLLNDLVRGATDRPLLVVVDQFEEIRTRCDNDHIRRTFLGALGTLTRPAAMIVLGLRSDHRAAAVGLGRDFLDIGPLTGTDLTDVIIRPAKRAGVRVAPDLVEEIRRDLGPGPDTLPLLSQVLLGLWQRRAGGAIGLAQYRACGGVAGVVAELAVAARGSLDPARRAVADRLVGRLADAPDLATGALLSESDGRRPDLAVLARLVAARVVTVDGDRVRVAHPALFASWPRLAVSPRG
jgi:transcriptional regulator with XRE-family HTH domain